MAIETTLLKELAALGRLANEHQKQVVKLNGTCKELVDEVDRLRSSSWWAGVRSNCVQQRCSLQAEDLGGCAAPSSKHRKCGWSSDAEDGAVQGDLLQAEESEWNHGVDFSLAEAAIPPTAADYAMGSAVSDVLVEPEDGRHASTDLDTRLKAGWPQSPLLHRDSRTVSPLPSPRDSARELPGATPTGLLGLLPSCGSVTLEPRDAPHLSFHSCPSQLPYAPEQNVYESSGLVLPSLGSPADQAMESSFPSELPPRPARTLVSRVTFVGHDAEVVEAAPTSPKVSFVVSEDDSCVRLSRRMPDHSMKRALTVPDLSSRVSRTTHHQAGHPNRSGSGALRGASGLSGLSGLGRGASVGPGSSGSAGSAGSSASAPGRGAPGGGAPSLNVAHVAPGTGHSQAVQRVGSAGSLPDQEVASGKAQFEVLPAWAEHGGGGLRRLSSRVSVSLGGYGSTELEDDQNSSCRLLQMFMRDPSALKHLVWDLFGLLLIFYDCVTIPLQVFDPPRTAFTSTLETVSRWFWTINIAASFTTGFIRDDGTIEMHPVPVARRYAMTWMPIDLVVVGFHWADLESEDAGSLHKFGSALRSIRILRIVRLMRLVKAPAITKLVTEHIRSEQLLLVVAIAKIMALFLWVAHLLACFWFGVGDWTENMSNWIDTVGMRNSDMGYQYAMSFYWSLGQFVGNSMVEPQNIYELVANIVIVFFVFVTSAQIVGSVTTSMTRLQLLASEQSSQFSSLRRYLLDNDISRALALRVQRNAQRALAEQKRNAPESSIDLLKIISNPLLIEVHFEVNSRVLTQHPFFKHYVDVNPAGMRKVCHIAISHLSLSAGDVLFSDFEVPQYRRMFFVQGGTLTYLQMKLGGISLEKGSWLSEAVLWTRWTHCGTARALRDGSRLQTLDADTFKDTVSMFPSDHAGAYAMEFVNWLNSERDVIPTDLGPSDEEHAHIIRATFPTNYAEGDSSDGSSEGSSDDWDDDEDCEDCEDYPADLLPSSLPGTSGAPLERMSEVAVAGAEGSPAEPSGSGAKRKLRSARDSDRKPPLDVARGKRSSTRGSSRPSKDVRDRDRDRDRDQDRVSTGSALSAGGLAVTKARPKPRRFMRRFRLLLWWCSAHRSGRKRRKGSSARWGRSGSLGHASPPRGLAAARELASGVWYSFLHVCSAIRSSTTTLSTLSTASIQRSSRGTQVLPA